MKKYIVCVGLCLSTAAHAVLVSKTLPPEAEAPAHCAAVYGALIEDPDSNAVQKAYYLGKSKIMVDQAVVEAETRGIPREEARKYTQNLLKQIQDTSANKNDVYQDLIKQELLTCEAFDVYRRTHQK